MTRVSRRWAAPAAAAVAIAAVGLAPRALAASPHPSLPAMSPAQLLAAAEQAAQQPKVTAMQGTVETKANLGLPALPDRLTNAGSGFAALLTGTHRIRLWAAGPDKQRIALLGDLTETDVVHNGTDTWLYDSTTGTVTHWTTPADQGRSREHNAAEQQLTPQAQAQRALHAVDPTTGVTVDPTARVAGRPAYQLVLTPRTDATLIRSVRIALDAATFAPLRVQLFAAGSSAPAWQTAFTKISYAAPAASTFAFRPPANATVNHHTPAAHTGRDNRAGTRETQHTATKPTTLGTGWASVFELPAGTVDLASPGPASPRDRRDFGSTAALLDRLTTTVPQGRLLSTRLLTALVTHDGRVFIGAVPASTIERLAASG